MLQQDYSLGIHHPKKANYAISTIRPFEFNSTFSISGTFLSHIIYINLNHLTFKTKTQDPIYISLKDIHLIPPAAFPLGFQQSHLMGVTDDAPNELRVITNFGFHIESYIANGTTCTSIPCTWENLTIYSQALKNECEAITENHIPIRTSIIPIFKTNKQQPNIEYLDRLYHDFYRFNKNDLDNQLKIFDGVCHLRAHFVSQFLETIGIETIKIYKFYDYNEWQKFTPGNSWSFHCATMIIDSKNNKWVWDPWDGKNKTLQSLKVWAYRDDQPNPIEIMLANKTVVNDLKGQHPGGADFRMLGSPKNFSSFQWFFTNALPNEPEKCLLSEDDKKTHLNYLENNKQSLITKKTTKNLKTLGLFKHQNALKEESEHPNLYTRLGCNII